MTGKLRIAIGQFPVSDNITANAKYIRRLMKKAVEEQVQLIHFPETALSGYGQLHLTASKRENWRLLEAQTKEIADLAGTLGLWVILGSCRKVDGHQKIANCTDVISNEGKIAGTYQKQKLTPAESAFYKPGKELLVVDINGLKCGFLICYELCFPRLFEEYRMQNVELIFHSCYNVSRKPRPLFQDLTLAQLRTRAADHRMWISSANSSARYSFSSSCLARPDGSVRQLKKHTTGILLFDFPDSELGWTYDSRK